MKCVADHLRQIGFLRHSGWRALKELFQFIEFRPGVGVSSSPSLETIAASATLTDSSLTSLIGITEDVTAPSRRIPFARAPSPLADTPCDRLLCASQSMVRGSPSSTSPLELERLKNSDTMDWWLKDKSDCHCF
jgi:hypothetical protein